jgi:hypothetical protein
VAKQGEFEGMGETVLPPDLRELRDTLIAAWNHMAGEHKLRRVVNWNPTYDRMFREAARQEWWREHVIEAIGLVPLNAYNLGKNRHGWKANMEWFLRGGTAKSQKHTVQRLIEEKDLPERKRELSVWEQKNAREEHSFEAKKEIASKPKRHKPAGMTQAEWDKLNAAP